MADSLILKELTDDQAASNFERVYVERPCLSAEDSLRRFVLLLPGKGNDALICSLVLRDMLSHEYEALSYTWDLDKVIGPQGHEWEDESSWEDVEDASSETGGEDGHELEAREVSDERSTSSMLEKASIMLNGLPIPVMPNLYAALQHLRYADHSRCLWIDYLCINQQSIADKNAQVLSMDAIYSHASQVIIWLGQPTEDSDDALRELQRLTANEHLTKLYGSSALSKSQVVEHVKPLVNLVSRGWFQRVWVVQEVALARQAVVQIGARMVPWTWFADAARTIGSHLDCCASIIRPLMNDNHGDYLLSLRACFANILAVEAQAKKPGLSLHEALRLFYARLATDPRDKIFALLGLLGPDARLVQPDYTADAREVYTNAAVSIISQTGDLPLLADVDELAGDVSVPTWVPDWTNIGILAANLYDFYRAAAGSTSAALTQCSPSSIRLQGIICDFASEVLVDHYPSDSANELLEAYTRFQRWEKLVRDKFGLGTEYFTGETYAEAFWHTFMMGVNASRTARLTPEDYEAWREWRRWIDGYASMGPRQQEAAIEEASWDENVKLHNDILAGYPAVRWFFVTDDGYIGLGPINMEERDMVCVLAGGKMPFVLRMVDETCESCGDEKCCCQFAGSVYVHGLMDGAMMEGIEAGTDSWREFCLR